MTIASFLLCVHCEALNNDSGPLSVFASALNHRELSRKIIDLFSKVFSLDEVYYPDRVCSQWILASLSI